MNGQREQKKPMDKCHVQFPANCVILLKIAVNLVKLIFNAILLIRHTHNQQQRNILIETIRFSV